VELLPTPGSTRDNAGITLLELEALSLIAAQHLRLQKG